MKRWSTVAAVASPGLALAAFGFLLHPAGLDVTTARAWWQLHVLLIPVFPLISVAIAVLLRGERGLIAWAARVAAYGFAAFYTGLDVLAGIGAGLVTEAQGLGPTVGRLFEVGNQLAATGIGLLLVSAVLTGAVLVPRDGPLALPGTVVLAASCFPFLTGHIFHPTGVLAMLGIAAGCAMLAAARRPGEPAALRAEEPATLVP